MKKVLIFSLVYYPKYVRGGAEPAIKEITDRIDPSDIEFHMVTLGYDSDLPKVSKEGNVLVHRIGLMKPGVEEEEFDLFFPLFLNKYLFQFLAAWKAYKLHKEYHYDALWAMLAHSCGVPAAIFKLFHPKVPYILTLQEGDPVEHIERVVRPLWPLFVRAFTTADVVQAISTHLGNWARSRGFKGPLEVIHNGANPKDIKDEADPKAVEALKKELGKKEGDVFLVNTARLVHQKANDITIRALPLLPSNVRLLLVGSGSDESMLKKLSKELNLSDRVIFAGYVNRSVVTLYRKVSDIFVGPSRSEGLGNTFLSAMASRLPVITTQEGGIADFLFDREKNPDKPTTGWAVEKDSPEQIAEAVKDILAHPDKVREITETARNLVFEKYNWDFISKNMRTKVFERAFAQKHS